MIPSPSPTGAPDPWASRAVVVAADDGYAEPLAVTLRSLVETQPEHHRLQVFVLDCGIEPDNLDRVRNSVPGLDVTFLPVGLDLLDGLPELGYYTRATYARLFLDRLLPTQIDRVIYLDADTLVVHDLAPLWSFELDGEVMAACIDPVLPVVGSALTFWRQVGLDPTLRYLNAGVLMIDLERWRHLRFGQRAVDVVSDFASSLRMPDQDAINVLVAGRFAVLPQRWNQMARLRRHEHVAHTFASPAEVETALDDPAIIHFNGMKPWIRACNDPAADAWAQVHARTAFHPLRLRQLRDADRPFAIPVRLKLSLRHRLGKLRGRWSRLCRQA